MEQLLKDVEQIKTLEIQGATSVALSAINFLSDYAKRIGNCRTTAEWFEKLNEAKDILINSRLTEPAMRNGLNYIIKKLEKTKDTISSDNIIELIEHYKNEYKMLLENSKRKIAEIGARRIPEVSEDREFIIMTHCHSSVVTGIILEAKSQGKDNIKVINTETQPRLQGRKTAKELLEAGIEVIHIVDSAMKWAVSHFEVDMILIGADSITSEGTVLNKIGSRLLALVAHEANVPFYVASPLLKYNPQTNFGILEKIEMRDSSEIWKDAPENIKILNPAFETVSRRYIDGLITEAGIFPSGHVHLYFSKLYPELVE
jgi:ribose 1,5-bisphosphate isomerase